MVDLLVRYTRELRILYPYQYGRRWLQFLCVAFLGPLYNQISARIVFLFTVFIYSRRIVPNIFLWKLPLNFRISGENEIFYV